MIRSRPLMLIALPVLLILSLGATVAWQRLTASTVAQAQRSLTTSTWLDVLPQGSYDNQPLEQPLPLGQPLLEHSTLEGAWRATLQGHTSAVLMQSRVAGYEGPIQLLIAIDSSARIIAVKTLNQTETPGLGDRIVADRQWANQFRNSRGGPYDQLAGASVTSRAVVHAIQDALRHFDEQRARWLAGEQ